MKDTTLFILGFGAVACLIYAVIRFKAKKPPVDTKEALLKDLKAQRERIAALQHRKNCAALFDGLSRGIQDFLAQENRPCPNDTTFCSRLIRIAENESLAVRLEARKPCPVPEPVDEETRLANQETLKEMIRVEKEKNPPLPLELAWERLVEAMVPVLNGLMESARASDADACRSCLRELKVILEQNHVQVVYYSDEMEQTNPDMKWDYEFGPGYPVPALYYAAEGRMIRVGAPGRTKND